MDAFLFKNFESEQSRDNCGMHCRSQFLENLWATEGRNIVSFVWHNWMLCNDIWEHCYDDRNFRTLAYMQICLFLLFGPLMSQGCFCPTSSWGKEWVFVSTYFFLFFLDVVLKPQYLWTMKTYEKQLTRGFCWCDHYQTEWKNQCLDADTDTCTRMAWWTNFYLH